MSDRANNMEDLNEKDNGFIPEDLRGITFRQLIDGSLLTRKTVLKQLPFIIVLSVLAVLYIANRYHAMKINREIIELQTEIRELRARSITTAAELMNLSRQSQVAKMVREKGMDLKESVTPPRVLK